MARRTQPTAEEKREAELEEGRMPFLSHLRELRDRIRNAAFAFAAAFIGCWVFEIEWESPHTPIYHWFRMPFDNAWRDAHLPGDPTLVFSSPTTPFWLSMEVAMWAAIFVSSPFIFYQLWKFIAPGLYKTERRIGVTFAACSGIFFVGGALFCFYFCMPALLGYLLGYAHDSQGLAAQVHMDVYFDLIRDMMIAFGAVFELPLLIYFLAKIGLVTHRGLWKFNRYFIVIAFVIGAVLTPSPDVVSQTWMAMPMVILYNVSIVIAWAVTRNKEKKRAAERAAEGYDDDDDESEEDDDDDDDESEEDDDE